MEIVIIYYRSFWNRPRTAAARTALFAEGLSKGILKSERYSRATFHRKIANQMSCDKAKVRMFEDFLLSSSYLKALFCGRAGLGVFSSMLDPLRHQGRKSDPLRHRSPAYATLCYTSYSTKVCYIPNTFSALFGE